jgi:hypothetical protein
MLAGKINRIIEWRCCHDIKKVWADGLANDVLKRMLSALMLDSAACAAHESHAKRKSRELAPD